MKETERERVLVGLECADRVCGKRKSAPFWHSAQAVVQRPYCCWSCPQVGHGVLRGAEYMTARVFPVGRIKAATLYLKQCTLFSLQLEDERCEAQTLV